MVMSVLMTVEGKVSNDGTVDPGGHDRTTAYAQKDQKIQGRLMIKPGGAICFYIKGM